MGFKMFYSEDDIRNIISKREMTDVSVSTIYCDDLTVMVKVGDGDWNSYKPEELGRLMFAPSKEVKVEFAEGGVFVEREG